MTFRGPCVEHVNQVDPFGDPFENVGSPEPVSTGAPSAAVGAETSVASGVPVADVAREIPVDSVDDVVYSHSCAGNQWGHQTETLTTLLVRHSHDDAPGFRVTGRNASTERSDQRRAALSRSHGISGRLSRRLGRAQLPSGLATSVVATIMIAALTIVAAVPTASADEHQVVDGDTLWTIAAEYGVSIDELVALNAIENPRALRIGDTLLLPDPPYEGATLEHIVQPGETLSVIAEMYGVSSAAVLRLNGIADADRIQVASVLQIPDPSAADEIEVAADFVIVETDYTVVSGDTLTAIAQAHEVEPGAIVRASGLRSANIIRVGQVLTVPKEIRLSPTERYAAMFERAAELNELDPNVLKALGWQESRWNPDAVSYAGAVGMTQIMPGTRDYIANELMGNPDLTREDASDNIAMGAHYLAYLLGLTEGNLEMALGSYYQGFTSVTRNGYRADTVSYIQSILAYAPLFESGELPNTN